MSNSSTPSLADRWCDNCTAWLGFFMLSIVLSGCGAGTRLAAHTMKFQEEMFLTQYCPTLDFSPYVPSQSLLNLNQTTLQMTVTKTVDGDIIIPAGVLSGFDIKTFEFQSQHQITINLSAPIDKSFKLDDRDKVYVYGRCHDIFKGHKFYRKKFEQLEETRRKELEKFGIRPPDVQD